MTILRSWASRAVRWVLNPHPTFPIPTSQYCSHLDVRVETVGMAAVDQMFAESPGIRRIAAAFALFLDDPEAELSLKKGVHEIHEKAMRSQALRLAPPERDGFDPVAVESGPLDRVALQDLTALCPDAAPPTPLPPAEGCLRLALSALSWGLATIAHAAFILIRHGCTQVSPRSYHIATQDFWPAKRWNEIIDAFGWVPPAREQFVVLLERKDNDDLARAGFATFDPDAAPVPRREWMGQVVIPAITLTARVMIEAVRGRDCRVLATAAECLHQAYLSLAIRRTIYHVTFRHCFDTVEYNPIHNLKGILYRKMGGGVVRLPYSEVDSYGAATAYLGYDLFFAGGSYVFRNFRASWRPGTRIASVGQLQNDRRRQAPALVKPEFRDAIEAHLAAGRKLLVYFGSSSVPGIPRVEHDILRALWSVAAEREDCALVIKPKVNNHLYDSIAAIPELRAMLESPRVVAIRYDGRDEVCPAGWLFERLDVGATLPGTIQVEGLLKNRLVLSYYPVAEDRELPRLLTEYGLRHRDAETFRRAVVSRLDGEGPRIPSAWLAEAFDPFADGDAISRMVTFLSAAPFGAEERLEIAR